MTRPFARSSIVELRKRFEDANGDTELLRQLADELERRTTPSSAELLDKVEVVLRSQRQSFPVPTTGPTPPPRVPTPPPFTKPGEPKQHPLPPSVEDAYRLLKASSSSTWESIEMQRRQQVQAANPTRTKGYSEQERSGALAQARLVNAAYAVISKTRAAKSADVAQ